MLKKLNLSRWISILSLTMSMSLILVLISDTFRSKDLFFNGIVIYLFWFTLYLGVYLSPIMIILLIMDVFFGNKNENKYRFLLILINVLIISMISNIGSHLYDNLHIG